MADFWHVCKGLFQKDTNCTLYVCFSPWWPGWHLAGQFKVDNYITREDCVYWLESRVIQAFLGLNTHFCRNALKNIHHQQNLCEFRHVMSPRRLLPGQDGGSTTYWPWFCAQKCCFEYTRPIKLGKIKTTGHRKTPTSAANFASKIYLIIHLMFQTYTVCCEQLHFFEREP